METYKLDMDSAKSVGTLIARVNAGLPLAVASDFEKLDLNTLLGNESSLLIRVRGESMLDSIADGDWILVDRRKPPISGNIVLAQLGEEFTVKTFEDDGRRGLRLAPMNGNYPTLHVTKDDDFSVIGTVVWIVKAAP